MDGARPYDDKDAIVMTSENSSRVEASGRDGGLCLGRGFDLMAKEGRLDKGVILAEHERWLDPEREREKARDRE